MSILLCQTIGFREIMYTIRPFVKIIEMREAAKLDEFYIFLHKKMSMRSSMCIENNTKNYWCFINI